MAYKKDKKYCVYMHTNKINGKKYIGITSQKPENRWRGGHGYRGKQRKFYLAILKYGWDNFDHVVIASNLSMDEACEMEVALIKKYNTAGSKTGYNTDLGGRCSVWTEERRKSIRGCNNSMYGRHLGTKVYRKNKVLFMGEKERSRKRKQ